MGHVWDLEVNQKRIKQLLNVLVSLVKTGKQIKG